jgi:hypothetical protein
MACALAGAVRPARGGPAAARGAAYTPPLLAPTAAAAAARWRRRRRRGARAWGLRAMAVWRTPGRRRRRGCSAAALALCPPRRSSPAGGGQRRAMGAVTTPPHPAAAAAAAAPFLRADAHPAAAPAVRCGAISLALTLVLALSDAPPSPRARSHAPRCRRPIRHPPFVPPWAAAVRRGARPRARAGWGAHRFPPAFPSAPPLLLLLLLRLPRLAWWWGTAVVCGAGAGARAGAGASTGARAGGGARSPPVMPAVVARSAPLENGSHVPHMTVTAAAAAAITERFDPAIRRLVAVGAAGSVLAFIYWVSGRRQPPRAFVRQPPPATDEAKQQPEPILFLLLSLEGRSRTLPRPLLPPRTQRPPQLCSRLSHSLLPLGSAVPRRRARALTPLLRDPRPARQHLGQQPPPPPGTAARLHVRPAVGPRARRRKAG